VQVEDVVQLAANPVVGIDFAAGVANMPGEIIDGNAVEPPNGEFENAAEEDDEFDDFWGDEPEEIERAPDDDDGENDDNF
jgi:hypothetical protein